jgi:protocatechuate 4,5-dioxygenase, alpha chain
MTMVERAFHEVPGTFVFDSTRSRQGYHLNMFCMSLMKAENRTAYKADEGKYLDLFPLSAEQRSAVLERRWNDMLRLGGNVYYIAKLAATDGWPVAHMSAAMAGLPPEAYVEMMVGGGRRAEQSLREDL